MVMKLWISFCLWTLTQAACVLVWTTACYRRKFFSNVTSLTEFVSFSPGQLGLWCLSRSSTVQGNWTSFVCKFCWTFTRNKQKIFWLAMARPIHKETSGQNLLSTLWPRSREWQGVWCSFDYAKVFRRSLQYHEGTHRNFVNSQAI